MSIKFVFNPFTGNFDEIYVPPAATGAPATPVVMSADLTLATQTQMLFRIPITVGSFKVNGAAGSYLVGV